MSVSPPLASIPVGVVVERVKGSSQWVDYLWRPTAVLVGIPETPPWTALSDDGERATFYVGSVSIELHRTETANYRDNLATGEPLLWVVLRRTESDPPYDIFTVLADPAEGEAMTQAGDDLVETVPMPDALQDVLAQFVTEHHVERQFVKRKRDRANTEALAKPSKRDRGE